MEIWPYEGRQRALFSGNDQFFEGILSKTIELNRADNPFPQLSRLHHSIMTIVRRTREGENCLSVTGQLGSWVADDKGVEAADATPTA